jgi:hypothetical protein
MTSTNTQFAPCAERYRLFDIRMRLRLNQSLRYLHEFSESELNISKSFLESGLNQILQHPVLPDCFAAYYELVDSIQNENYSLAQQLFEEVLSPDYAVEGGELFAFQDPDTDSRSKRYKSKVDTNPDLPFAIQPVGNEAHREATHLINESFELLRQCAPELHDEIREILNVICIGAGPLEPQSYTFDGASAFELWGAILLNAVEAKDVVDMVQTLAHESCHVMLFGFCIDGALILNPDSERYASPLRLDPRPIDGIYHATFVLARMHYSAEKLRDSGQLSPELQTKVESELKQRATSFYDGLKTLKAHARYTPEGAALMESAEAYMNSVYEL